MNKKIVTRSIISTLLTIGILVFSLPAVADKPSWAGNPGNGSKNYKKNREKQKDHGDDYSHGQNNAGSNINVYFTAEQKKVISNYYREEYHSGHCPPGLAKKKNGCMPPGQAKKWKRGYPLAREVIYYDLPAEVVIQLGRPPEGHRYVRVASDILLIAIGTGMIVDAVEDLYNL